MSNEVFLPRAISKLSFFRSGIWKDMSFASNITALSWFPISPKLEARPFAVGSCSIFLFFEKGSPLACAVPLDVVPGRSC
jgi:hypothetical protein